jgi:hypothetical protein
VAQDDPFHFPDDSYSSDADADADPLKRLAPFVPRRSPAFEPVVEEEQTTYGFGRQRSDSVGSFDSVMTEVSPASTSRSVYANF